jgi:hypothetical protein
MTGAIFGLIGVVIGGLLTAATQAVQQARADRATARAASRLLSAELSEQHVFLDALVNRETADPTNAGLPAVSAWPEYRATMARLLDDETWQAVAGAYVELALFHSERALDPRALDDRVQEARARLQHVWRRAHGSSTT